VQDFPGDVGRRLQEQDGVHDVADLASAAEWDKSVNEVLVAPIARIICLCVFVALSPTLAM
jgi:hypothetical protein